MDEAEVDPIERWHAYLAAAPSEAALDALLDDDVVFRSPAVHTPQHGKTTTMQYLGAAATVLGNPSFRYVGEWRTERSAVLEFKCEIAGGVGVHGVDIIEWNESGRIVTFTVMIRPLKALTTIVPLMAAALSGG